MKKGRTKSSISSARIKLALLGLIVLGALGAWWAARPLNAKEQCARRKDETATRMCQTAYRAEPSKERLIDWLSALVEFKQVDELDRLGKELDDPAHRVRARIYWCRSHASTADSPEGYREGFEEALGLAQQSNMPLLAAEVAYNWFHTEYGQQNLAAALEAARTALRWGRVSQSRKWQREAAMGLASVLLDLGDLEGVIQAADTALALSEPTEVLRIALALNQKGLAYREKGKLQLARRYLLEAARHGEKESVRRYAYDIYWNLAAIELDRGDVEAARPWVEKVLTQFPERGRNPQYPSRESLQAQFNAANGAHKEAIRLLESALENEPAPIFGVDMATRLGKAYEQLGAVEAARASYRRAVKILESLRDDVRIERFKSTHLAVRRTAYERLFALSDSPRERARWLDRAKGRVFEESFAQPRRSVAETATTGSNGEPIGSSQAWIREALRVLPLLHNSNDLDRPPWSEIEANLLEHQVLAWFLVEDELNLVGVWAGSIRHASLGPVGPILETLRGIEAQPGNRALARELGALLLPTSLELDRDRTVYLVPDGELARVPLGLVEWEGEPLLVTYPLAYVPSFSALRIFSERSAKRLPNFAPPAVLAAGSNLGFAQREATQVAEQLGVQPSIGATRADLYRAGSASLLHVASHGGVGIWASWLELKDGQVFPSDILRRRLAPKTVVLASCASAAPNTGDLWSSLAGTFLASGAESVVASLWSVTDEEAETFIRSFYRNGGGEAPVRGLAQTRRQLAKSGAPIGAWAPFVVLGGVTD